MSVEVPTSPAYYYECSPGRFRLSYYLPPAELKKWVNEGRLREEVLLDFPDGIDLDCTESDFDDFQKSYGFRPPLNADWMRGAFYSLLSDTKEFESFSGTGFVTASAIEDAAEILRSEAPRDAGDPAALLAMEESLDSQQIWSSPEAAAPLQQFLKNQTHGIVDHDKTIQQQQFSNVPMGKGLAIQNLFQTLHRRRGGQS